MVVPLSLMMRWSGADSLSQAATSALRFASWMDSKLASASRSAGEVADHLGCAAGAGAVGADGRTVSVLCAKACFHCGPSLTRMRVSHPPPGSLVDGFGAV